MVARPRPDGALECRDGVLERHWVVPLAGSKIDPGATGEGPGASCPECRRQGDAALPSALYRRGGGNAVAVAQRSRPCRHGCAGRAVQAVLTVGPATLTI